jgi:hypothetical protein
MADISNDAYIARMAIVEACAFIAAPHTRMRPVLTRDGNMYCALYSENIHEGCAGFGESPAHAMEDFDRNWSRKIAALKGDTQ